MSPSRGIIPAYAGLTSWSWRSLVVLPDHPRLRGVNVLMWQYTDEGRGIIPAYAGLTGLVYWAAKQLGDHPRLRGVNPVNTRVYCEKSGSSPLTRG